MRGKDIKLITSVEESKGVAASILKKARRLGERRTNAVKWTWQSREHCQFSQIRLVYSKFGESVI